MSERPIANETACPIPLERLSLLLRSSSEEVDTLALALPERQRAALAAFCYNRQHLRDLAYRVAYHCEPRALLAAAGTAGLILYDQALEAHDGIEHQPSTRIKGVSLAKRA